MPAMIGWAGGGQGFAACDAERMKIRLLSPDAVVELPKDLVATLAGDRLIRALRGYRRGGAGESAED